MAFDDDLMRAYRARKRQQEAHARAHGGGHDLTRKALGGQRRIDYNDVISYTRAQREREALGREKLAYGYDLIGWALDMLASD